MGASPHPQGGGGRLSELELSAAGKGAATSANVT